MNHQPFRNWLLSEEALSDEQLQSLREHLASCDSCSQIDSAWRELAPVLRHPLQVEPALGFTSRWQAHLAEYEARQKARQGWVSIGITTFIALALFIIFVIQAWSVMINPGPTIAVLLNQLVSIISDYYILQNMIRMYTWLNPFSILIGMFFLFGMISFMTVLWVTTYRKINLARRKV